jgi:hypothetical protein
MTNVDFLLELSVFDLQDLLDDAHDRLDSARGLRETTKAIDWKRCVQAARRIVRDGTTEKRARAFNSARKAFLSH